MQRTAKDHLKINGWTQQDAASHLGVTLSYFNRVLNGELKSIRLVNAALALPPKDNTGGTPACIARLRQLTRGISAR